jgi:hypothetical protein
MFDPRADLFFEKPETPPTPPAQFGVLYLLRRDICYCFGRHPTNGCKMNCQALWPGGMAIFAGIDLIAKFYKGDDNIRQAGKRFKDLVRQYFQPLSCDDEETIYQLRNSLLHSFGLYSKSKNQTYRFLLTAAGQAPLVRHRLSSDCYHIDLVLLLQRFEQALQRYAQDLDVTPLLQNNFLKMFQNCGSIRIG